MKFLSLILLCIFFTHDSALAKVNLAIVGQYKNAANPAVWQNVGANDVPASLITVVDMENPDQAYAAPYQTAFLQNKWLVVCWESCSSAQALRPTREGQDYKTSAEMAKHPAVIAQATVYYWVSALFARMEALGYKPSKKLTVIVNRQVAEPTAGIEMRNNAFFNDKTWSLSFLGNQNTLLSRLMNQKLLPSFFDPSVAIHEATHSVFEHLIGDIINSEIYGLHEAFADYFALAILDSPELGAVMGRGKPLRTAKNLIKYQPGMEAHDLGNVVVAALWKLRALYPNKNWADLVALETVRQVSLNPYGSAGDVVSAYQAAYQKAAANGGQLAASDAVAGVWAETGLKPTIVRVNSEVLVAPVSRQKYVAAEVITQVPEAISREWGIPTSSQIGVVNLEKRPGPQGSDMAWYNFALSSSKVTIPLWILFSEKTTAIAAAYIGYSPNLQPITRGDQYFPVLLQISENLQAIFELDEAFGAQAMTFFDVSTNPIMGKLLKNGPVMTAQGPQVNFNGQNLRLKKYTREIQQRFLGNLLSVTSGLADPNLKALVRVIRAVSFYTVPEVLYKSHKLMPKLVPGETVVGYTMTYCTGLQSTVLITDIKEAQAAPEFKLRH